MFSDFWKFPICHVYKVSNEIIEDTAWISNYQLMEIGIKQKTDRNTMENQRKMRMSRTNEVNIGTFTGLLHDCSRYVSILLV